MIADPKTFREWEEDCIRYHGKVLENTDKAHWCCDWDQLPINESCQEFLMCCCYLGSEDE